jgi:hypothetical protein
LTDLGIDAVNNRMDLKRRGLENVIWIHLAQDSCVHSNVLSVSIKCGGFLG